MTANEDEEVGEISPEALRQLNALLDQAPGEDAPEEEVEAFMKKISETPGGGAMLRSLTQELASGGGELLGGLLGRPGLLSDDEFEPSLYQRPGSPLRLVFRIQVIGSKQAYWRRVTLPADACFFDLHYALQDSFGLHESLPHRFEWREGERVVATFLTGVGDAKEGDDYCGFQNRPLDLFSEGAERLFYYQEGAKIPAFAIFMEKLIEQNNFENPNVSLPRCIGGEGPGKDFDLPSVNFRIPGHGVG